MKRCTICGETKGYSEFHRQASRRDGYANWCKPCKKQKKRDDYVANRDRILEKLAKYRRQNPEKVSACKKACRAKKIEQYKARGKQKYLEGREQALLRQAEYRRRNWPRVLAWNTAYKRERLRSDPLFRLEYAVRNRTFVAFRDRGYGKGSRTRELIGCDWADLMAHMSAQFTPGMTIENYGEWHVDHIIPLSSASSEGELIRLCHYTNLQPLWAAENIRKGASMPESA